MNLLRPVLVVFGSLSLLTGLVYPLALTGLSRALFPRQSEGSLIRKDGVLRGSALIGQHTEDPRYFWGRLSATPEVPTHGGSSSGSNLAPSHPDLRKNAEKRIAGLREADPGNLAPIPVDLVTASGSGLDPHITPAAAAYQADRVARIRGLDPAKVRALVQAHTEGRTFGLLGEPRVKALALNLALDDLK